MQKAEAQHSQKQNQPAQRRSGNAELESPQGEQIAQLEAAVEHSEQSGGWAQMAAMADNSPAMAAQRRVAEGINTSPYVTTQRNQLNGIGDGTAQRAAAEAKSNNTGLPDNLKSGIESLSGISMDNVKVHYNSSQPAQLNAHAYAQGTDIHVAPGQEKHLPHEAWHVVQQAQGRVKPTMQMKEGVPVNDDAGLEREADVMGDWALVQRVESNHQGETDSRLNSAQLLARGVVQCSFASDAQEEFDSHTVDYNFAKTKFDTEMGDVAPLASGDSNAAKGLLHWARETKRAAVRHYNELTSVRNEGGVNKGVYLGSSNTVDPDVYIDDGTGLLEVKTNDSDQSTDVDSLVYEAFQQLIARSGVKTTRREVNLYLENKDNYWPYTATEGSKNYSPTSIANRMSTRSLHVTGNNGKVTIKVWYKKRGWVTVPYSFDGA